MDGIAYNNRQMKDSLKIFIYPLHILKIGWLNLKIPSLNKETFKETIQLNGTNEIER